MSWHNDTNEYDMWRDSFGEVPPLEVFYRDMANRMAKNKMEMFSEYLYLKFGRPRWLISAENLETLKSLQVPDKDLTGIQWPWDSFTILFDHESELLPGIPLRWMRISSPQSPLAVDCLKNKLLVVEKSTGPSISDMFCIQLDCGKDRFDGFDRRRPLGDTYVMYRSSRLTAPYAEFDGLPVAGFPHECDSTMPTEQARVLNEALKIAVRAVMLWAARPEFEVIKKHRVSISDRKMVPGEHIFRLALEPDGSSPPKQYPTEKKIYVDGANATQDDGEPAGKKKRHHFRGWVLATLRHEKFYRNRAAPPPFRVSLRQPCEIHAEENQRV